MEKEENKVLFNLEKKPLKSEREEIRKKRINILKIIMLCVFFLCVGLYLGFYAYKTIHPIYKNTSLTTLSEIEYAMDNFWLYSPEHENLKQELEDKAMYGMSQYEEDPYTTYMSAEDMNSFSSSINMNYVGIGVQYTTENDIAIVTKVFKDSPAEKAGIIEGDIIKAVDGTPIEGLDSDAIKELVLGEAGTEVIITVQRNAENLDLSVIRGAINSSAYAYPENDYLILEISSFGEGTAKEVMKYLDAYSEYRKLIIDMRNDGGGYQTAVRELCGLFIGPNEVYLRQRDVKGREYVDTTPADSKLYDGFEKIIILTNNDTASAAEVFTIVMKEKVKNVTLVGETTYGKGVIQSNKLLSNGGALKLTTYYWYSPDGVSIDKVGIKPDVEVRMPEIFYQYYYNMEEDEKYEIDSVSRANSIAQMVLEMLGYDINRTDGYFDSSLAEALIKYKGENGLGAIASLDKETYDYLISEARRQLAKNPELDLQMLKAKELLNED